MDKINTGSPLRAAKVNSIHSFVSLLSEIKRVPRIRDPYPVTNVSIVEIVLHGDRIFPRPGSAGIDVYVPGIHPANVIPLEAVCHCRLRGCQTTSTSRKRRKGGEKADRGRWNECRGEGRRRGWRALSAGNRTRVATTDSCGKRREREREESVVELIILRKNGLAAKLSGSSAVAFCYTMGEGEGVDAFSRCSFRYVKKKKERNDTSHWFFFFFWKENGAKWKTFLKNWYHIRWKY